MNKANAVEVTPPPPATPTTWAVMRHSPQCGWLSAGQFYDIEAARRIAGSYSQSVIYECPTTGEAPAEKLPV